MHVRPRIVYKYKSVSTQTDFNRVLDTIKNNHIYLPKPSMLNDPMEANAVEIRLTYAGASYTFNCGKILSPVEDEQNKYQVLSLSAIPNSPIMWAHYASGYSGCCLVYSTEMAFSKVEPIIYTDMVFRLGEEDLPDDISMANAVRESLRFKHKDWAYENEWRIIRCKDTDYLEYEPSELLGIIIGENMNLDRRKVLVKLCEEKNVPCFRTYTMRSWNEIAFVPFDLVESLDGPESEYITPRRMEIYIQEKIDKGMGIPNERELFRALNEKVLRDQYY